MVKHLIILSSSYSLGKRIALDFIISCGEDINRTKEVYKRIISNCGDDVSISTHYIETSSEDWHSVKKVDPYFDDVKLVSESDEFIHLIMKDRALCGLDVAKYILCMIKCTHLKLEKLTYLCYADYICKYNDKLFDDKIFAYKYGPVVESVYKKYHRFSYSISDKDTISDKKISESYQMPAKSRIVFAKNGAQKLISIDETLKKYGQLSASSLVDLTHKEQSPWSVSGKGMLKDEIISDDIIVKHHIYEK